MDRQEKLYLSIVVRTTNARTNTEESNVMTGGTIERQVPQNLSDHRAELVPMS